jgi:chemotaxis protein MotB
MADQPIIIKKVKRHGKGHHGGSWKVAFADFMTAMMAFFLVMWIIGLDQETRSAIAGYFRDPLDFMKKARGGRLEELLKSSSEEVGKPKEEPKPAGPAWKEQEQRELEAVKEEFEKVLQGQPDLKELEKYVELRLNDEGLVIEFLEGVGSVFFETGSAVIKPQGRRIFSLLGRVLAKRARHIVIDGHTDAQPYPEGAKYDNWNLSQDRALATLQVLRQAGVRDQNVLGVRGFADRRLRDPSNPFHYSNRRVTVLVPYQWAEERVIGSAGVKKVGEAVEWVPPVDIRTSGKGSK